MFSQSSCVPCQGGIPPLNSNEIQNFMELINPDWEVLEEKKIFRDFMFDDYNSAIRFTNSVAELSEIQGHHPYIHINFKTVRVIVFTHKINGLHENDFLLASKIDELF